MGVLDFLYIIYTIYLYKNIYKKVFTHLQSTQDTNKIYRCACKYFYLQTFTLFTTNYEKRISNTSRNYSMV